MPDPDKQPLTEAEVAKLEELVARRAAALKELASFNKKELELRGAAGGDEETQEGVARFREFADTNQIPGDCVEIHKENPRGQRFEQVRRTSLAQWDQELEAVATEIGHGRYMVLIRDPKKGHILAKFYKDFSEAAYPGTKKERAAVLIAEDTQGARLAEVVEGMREEIRALRAVPVQAPADQLKPVLDILLKMIDRPAATSGPGFNFKDFLEWQKENSPHAQSMRELSILKELVEIKKSALSASGPDAAGVIQAAFGRALEKLVDGENADKIFSSFRRNLLEFPMNGKPDDKPAGVDVAAVKRHPLYQLYGPTFVDWMKGGMDAGTAAELVFPRIPAEYKLQVGDVLAMQDLPAYIAQFEPEAANCGAWIRQFQEVILAKYNPQPKPAAKPSEKKEPTKASKTRTGAHA